MSWTRPTARGQRVCIEEQEDGARTFWHGEHDVLATAFPREHGVQQGDVVDSKRLSATLDFIKRRQHDRTEAAIAKSSTTRRECGNGKSVHFYFGPT